MDHFCIILIPKILQDPWIIIQIIQKAPKNHPNHCQSLANLPWGAPGSPGVADLPWRPAGCSRVAAADDAGLRAQRRAAGAGGAKGGDGGADGGGTAEGDRWGVGMGWWFWDDFLDGYGSIPIDTFLVGWTSIYQLFWCSPGVQGFDTLPDDVGWVLVESWIVSNWLDGFWDGKDDSNARSGSRYGLLARHCGRLLVTPRREGRGPWDSPKSCWARPTSCASRMNSWSCWPAPRTGQVMGTGVIFLGNYGIFSSIR